MQTLRWRYRGLYAVTEGIEHLHNPPERKETHNLETSIHCETPGGSVSGVNATDVNLHTGKTKDEYRGLQDVTGV